MDFSKTTEKLIDIALEEDIGTGDITSLAIFKTKKIVKAKVYAKSNLVLCGNKLAQYIFNKVDSEIKFVAFKKDGDVLSVGTTAFEITGDISSILKAERTVLNFIQRLSGISTATKEFVDLIKGSNVDILDTRKTAPGFRELDKYAVRVGGGKNHRMALYDMILIKDNHIDGAGSVSAAIKSARDKWGSTYRVIVEVRDEAELKEALSMSPDHILLDNMSIEELKKSVEISRTFNPNIYLEASGGITRETIKNVSNTGINGISSGFLTHSVKASDLSLVIC